MAIEKGTIFEAQATDDSVLAEIVRLVAAYRPERIDVPTAVSSTGSQAS